MPATSSPRSSAACSPAALWVIARGVDGLRGDRQFAANGYGEHSPGGFNLVAVLVTEMVLTAVFLYVILGATDTRAPKGFAPLAIGLVLTLIHLVASRSRNTSVNPARSTGVAFFNGNGAVAALGVLAGTDPRCRHRRRHLPPDHRRGPPRPRHLRRDRPGGPRATA